MSGGVYNKTFFENHPLEKEKEGVLYGIVLVNKQTWERERNVRNFKQMLHRPVKG